MDQRTWTDPSGRTWMVSLYSTPGNHRWIRFRNPKNVTKHGSVAYTSDKQLSELSDEEIAVYREQVVVGHPELA